MKQLFFRRFTCSILLFVVTSGHTQNLIIDLNFDGYNGTVSSVPAGFYFSWNSTSSNSFYTSSSNYGAASPSYKFGNDGDFIVTPMVMSADSLSFFSKGNGSPFSPLNELRILHSTDSINWINDTTITPLSASGTYHSVSLNQVSGYFKFEYFKSPAGGNLAFDDLKIYSSISTAIIEGVKKEEILIYPTPTTGIVNMKLNNSIDRFPEIEIFDMLGNKLKYIKIEQNSNGVFTFNLTGQKKGFYFIKIQTNEQFLTKRITLTE